MTGEVCFPNIGRRHRRGRLAVVILAGVSAALLLAWLVLSEAPRAWRLLVALPALIGVACIWGDLLESAIKREFGKKDAGEWLPGFGGILDRIDSLIISLPLVLYVFWLVD